MYRALRDVLKTPPCLIKNIGRCILRCYGCEGLSRETGACPVENSTPPLRGVRVHCFGRCMCLEAKQHGKGVQQGETARGGNVRGFESPNTRSTRKNRSHIGAHMPQRVFFLLSKWISFGSNKTWIEGFGFWSNRFPPCFNLVNLAWLHHAVHLVLGERGKNPRTTSIGAAFHYRHRFEETTLIAAFGLFIFPAQLFKTATFLRTI